VCGLCDVGDVYLFTIQVLCVCTGCKFLLTVRVDGGVYGKL